MRSLTTNEKAAIKPILQNRLENRSEINFFKKRPVPMLSAEEKKHLEMLVDELIDGAEACASKATPLSTILFILTSVNFMALYFSGSRRHAGSGGSRAFYQFLCRYFSRFTRDAKDDRGRFRRIRIPLLREGGKAYKTLKVPSALIHLYQRGVLEDLIAGEGRNEPCVVMQSGRWGFQIHATPFLEDFKEALRAYKKDVMDDPLYTQRFLQRYRHIHGW